MFPQRCSLQEVEQGMQTEKREREGDGEVSRLAGNLEEGLGVLLMFSGRGRKEGGRGGEGYC